MEDHPGLQPAGSRNVLSGARTKSAGRDVVAVLDLGSSKVACIIARLEPSQEAGAPAGFTVLGIGHQRSRGVKAGVVLDLEEAEAAIRAAVSQAERMAGVSVTEVLVSLACGRLRSQTFLARADIDGGIVSSADINRLLGGARAYAERDGRLLVHLNQLGYYLDGATGVSDARGMAANVLAADMHAVTADDSPVRNLLLAVQRCYLEVAGLVVAPYASALAVTTPEERRLGITVVDIGGGTSTIAMFAEDHFIYADALPVGGNHVTFDIARALSAPVAEAERIKALYGTMVRARSDEQEIISYPLAGEDDGNVGHTTKAGLHEVLCPRVEMLLSLVRERIARAPAAHVAGSRVVVTGGASQLVGLAERAVEVLACPVRVARPVAVGGLPPSICSPAFAVAVGMLHAVAAGGVARLGEESEVEPAGYLQRVGAWLKEF